MSIKLNFEQIDNIYSRDNFRLIEKFINDISFLDGDFTFYEFNIKSSGEHKLYHNSNLKPNDVIVTKSIGEDYQIDYSKFTDQYITVNTSGECYLRLFIGNMKGENKGSLQSFASDLNKPILAHIYNEKPTLTDSSSELSELLKTPIESSIRLYLNGNRSDEFVIDYDSKVITMSNPLSISDIVIVDYDYLE